MKKMLLWVLLLIASGAFANTSIEEFIQGADQLLKKEVKNGQVDYQSIKHNIQLIDELYQQIGSTNIDEASENEKKAFYINAYNIIAIHEVTEYYPLKSPMDKSGFFDQVKHTVAGEDLTLNALETKKIIRPYQDPRIHFVLACAAKSCPPLASFAYLPEKLDEQLDARTQLSLNDPEFIKVNNKDKTVQVSQIFDWYKNDFTQNGQTILGFINQYRDDKIPTDYQLSFYEYNWQLNDH